MEVANEKAENRGSLPTCISLFDRNRKRRMVGHYYTTEITSWSPDAGDLVGVGERRKSTLWN